MARHAKSHNAETDLACGHGRRFSASEKQPFYYPNCTTHELGELEELYSRRGYTIIKQLNSDGRTWFVSVVLPVSNHQPRTPLCYRQRIWR
ncbi:hypothetical protein HH746_004423 [Escherichia coli]|nr:hypothetical protein [Escherichia coli]